MLYVFEDNEAVIKMIIKGRSPTMRQVSRTHRVALDWLFDRSNPDSKIQIRYIDTKHQNVTNGTIILICSTSAISALSAVPRILAWWAASKGWRKGCKNKKKENRVVAKSRPTVMNLALSVSTSSSSVNSPIASRSLGILRAPSRQIGFSGRPGVSENPNSNPDAASSSQGWQRDALLDISTGRHVAADKDQKYLNHQDKNRHRGTCSTWIPRISRKSSNSIRFRRFGTRKSNLATSFLYITTLCWSHGESLLNHKKDSCSETDGWLEGSRWKVDQRSGVDQGFVHDWLEPAYVERIISTVWWRCSYYEIKNLRLCRLSAMYGRLWYCTSPSLEGQN